MSKKKLSEYPVEDLRRVVVNPFFAVNISRGLVGLHEPLTTKERWISANKRLIKQMGVEGWLALLLSVLEGNYVIKEEWTGGDNNE